MKKSGIILLAGLAAGVLAYACLFFSTAGRRNGAAGTAPELAWLKAEFRLSDEQFARVALLHALYRPTCAEMCRRIDEKNAALQTLLAARNSVTPEIQAALAEAARVRAECQSAMLNHVYEVSRMMPPEQARRYLAFMHERTLLPARASGIMPMDAHP